jgi:hypothetical protein
VSESVRILSEDGSLKVSVDFWEFANPPVGMSTTDDGVAMLLAELGTVRLTPGENPKASIMDFVMLVTAQNNDRAGGTIRLLRDKKKWLFEEFTKYQFPGQYCMPIVILSPTP